MCASNADDGCPPQLPFSGNQESGSTTQRGRFAAREGIRPTQVSHWKRQLIEGMPGGALRRIASRELAREPDEEIQDRETRIEKLTCERD